MKRILLTTCLVLLTFVTAGAALKTGDEYYIWLNIYEKLLGSNAAGNGPALSAYGTRSDGYVFVAEDAGKSGYVLLRQKSSGKYLAASSADSWSVTLEAKSTDDRFCWMADEGTYVYLINKKNSKYLGIDGANKGSTYVSVYYDKPKGSHSQYSIIPATGSSWDEARQAYQSEVYTNAQGVSEVDYCQLKDKDLDYSDNIDIHITSNDHPMTGSSVNLGSDRTWLVFDNIVPSEVINNYLSDVTINGQTAENGVNCRVAIFLNGAVVIPTPDEPMVCESTVGDFSLDVGNHADLGEQRNTMTGFTLRRGYMATLATGTNGSGYSRVFVADHADQIITLPQALSRRVVSVNIKPWQYLSKKGWGDTGGATRGPELRATWYWSWSADYDSTTDMEYVPCRQHRWWPGVDKVNSKTATASLSINEPEHPEQHTSEKCSCGGTMSVETVYGVNKDFLPGGGRIGSTQPTDFSYLTDYCKMIDDNKSRCDFAVTHAYWDIGSRDANTYARFVTDQCWTVWNNTKRPVWLTEMELGASWNNYAAAITSYDVSRTYLQVLLQGLEECDYIERYAIYSFDYWRNKMFKDDGSITPAGEVYRDHRSTFAYHANCMKIPEWWDEPEEDYISNPGIRTASKDAVPGWTCQRSAGNGYTKDAAGDTYLEVWNATPTNMAFDYFQNVNALPSGVYQLKAACFNSSNGVSGAYVNGNVGLYALADGVEYFSPVTDDSGIDYSRKTVIEKIVVRNGTMRIGIKNQGPMTARWAGADDFELTYLGTEEDVLGGEGDAFMDNARKERDLQLQALFTDDGAGTKDASVLIKNSDCRRNDLYGWTTKNLSTISGQAWDGDNDNTYFDSWGGGSLTSSMTQTIGYLPAGDYTPSALLRCTEGQTITLEAVHHTIGGEEAVYQETLTGTGDASVSGSPYERGWQKVTLPTFTAESGDRLTISASISTSTTSWWSADHFALTWLPTACTITINKDTETFTPSLPIDFTTPVSGLKAYTVKEVTGGKARLEEVTGAVPAGTGLILKGTAGETYEIPGAAGNPAGIANMLIGVLTDTQIGGNNLDYILYNGKFVKASSGTLKAGKAYLRLTEALAREAIDIDDAATAISDNRQKRDSTDEEYYNLSGIKRLPLPTKNVYIKGGKKTIGR